MSTPTQDTLWLTQAALDRLQTELDELTHAAGEANVATDARIGELRSILRRAQVGDKPDDGLVEPGMQVTVTFEGDDESTVFLLAQRGIAADDADIDVYSPTSPLGIAITGTFPGDAFAYVTPGGATVRGTVIAAEPFRG